MSLALLLSVHDCLHKKGQPTPSLLFCSANLAPLQSWFSPRSTVHFQTDIADEQSTYFQNLNSSPTFFKKQNEINKQTEKWVCVSKGFSWIAGPSWFFHFLFISAVWCYSQYVSAEEGVETITIVLRKWKCRGMMPYGQSLEWYCGNVPSWTWGTTYNAERGFLTES